MLSVARSARAALCAAALAAMAGAAGGWGGSANAAEGNVRGSANLAEENFREVREFVQHTLQARDNKGLPFAIVDKKQARLYVFTAQGKLAGTSSALLGATVGDFAMPGVGERAQRGEMRDDERTTPAGRYLSKPGRNLKGEHVVWIDYKDALAIHRLRPGKSQAARQASLDTPTPDDNRMSLGCVIVPVQFYTDVVQRVLGAGASVVYVMPEGGAGHPAMQELQRSL